MAPTRQRELGHLKDHHQVGIDDHHTLCPRCDLFTPRTDNDLDHLRAGEAYVMVRPWKAGNYLLNRSLVRFRIIRMAFVFGIIIKKETGESRIVRCHHDTGSPQNFRKPRFQDVYEYL